MSISSLEEKSEPELVAKLHQVQCCFSNPEDLAGRKAFGVLHKISRVMNDEG